MTKYLQQDVKTRVVVTRSFSSVRDLATQLQDCFDVLKDSNGMFCIRLTDSRNEICVMLKFRTIGGDYYYTNSYS